MDAIPSATEQCRPHIAELAGIIAVSADIVARYAELGDDAGLQYQIRRLILHVKAATQTFKDLAALTDSGGADGNP